MLSCYDVFMRSLAPACLASGCDRTPPPGAAYCGSCAEAAGGQVSRGEYALARAQEEAAWAKLGGNEDAVKAQLARQAFFDYRMFLAPDGSILPPGEWPEDAWRVVSGVEEGAPKVESRGQALKALAALMAKQKDPLEDAGRDNLIKLLRRSAKSGPPDGIIEAVAAPADEEPPFEPPPAGDPGKAALRAAMPGPEGA